MEGNSGSVIVRQVSAFKDGVVNGAEENICLGIPFSLTAPAYCYIFETGVKKTVGAVFHKFILGEKVSNVAFYNSSLMWWSLDVPGLH